MFLDEVCNEDSGTSANSHATVDQNISLLVNPINEIKSCLE